MRPPSWSALRYLIVGAANSLIGLVTIFGCKALLGLGDVPANALGYAVGIAVSFVLNKRWTFVFAGPALPALARFLGVLAVAYQANLATVLALVAAGVDGYLAQTLGIVPYTAIGYVGSRFFAFADSRSSAPIEKRESQSDALDDRRSLL